MFRVSNARRPTPGNGAPQLHYVLVFRLNRPKLRLKKRAPGALLYLGNFSIGGLKFLYDNPIFSFDPIDGTPDRDNCFIGEVTSDVPSIVHQLNAIPLGTRVRVRLRPVTPGDGRGAVLGTAYVRHPRLLPMRVKADDTTGLEDQVQSRGALDEVRRIGCSATVVD